MNLLRDNKSQKYLIFDFETESLNLLSDNRPWGLAYIIYQNGVCLKKINRFIKWNDLHMSEGAARVTRFNYDDYVKKAEDARKVLDDFEAELNNPEYICIYHNGSNFDIYILKIWREALGRKNDYSYLDRTIDTNSIARALKKGVKQIKPEERKMMMFRFGNYVEKGLKTSLTALGKEFNIQVDYTGLHDALRDVELNIMVWDKLKYQIEI